MDIYFGLLILLVSYVITSDITISIVITIILYIVDNFILLKMV